MVTAGETKGESRLELLCSIAATSPSHGSWMENFPWTRLPDVEPPKNQRAMVDLAKLRLLDPASLRKYIGDGNYGGLYQRPDDDMLALWQVAVEETRALLTSGWGD